ncbi:MAG: hypothetical protein ACI35Z_12765 [Sphingobacterium hotanense]
MKRSSAKYLLGLSLFIVASCQSNSGETVKDVQAETTSGSSYTDILDVDTKYLEDTDYVTGKSKIPDSTLQQVKEIVRRVYSHIEVKDNQYILTAQNGKEIGISEAIFKLYKKSLDETNAVLLKWDKEAKESGVQQELILPSIKDEDLKYLDSL